MKRVGVVILNYKVREEVLKCLKSVQDSDYGALTIIVVDNDSGDSLEQDIAKTPAVTFIQSGRNLGYTGGNNVGIKRALELGVDYVFVLNPDTQVLKNTIKILVSAAENGVAAMVGPKIYFADSKKIWFAGGVMDLNNVLGSHKGVDQIDSGQFDTQYEPDYLTGAAILVRADVFQKIGYFDERYFLYYEDSDFSFRARQAGFKLLYVPEAVVYHANAKSTGLGSPLQDYYITRNRMLFAAKFLSFRTRLALFREALRHLDKPVRRQAFWDFCLGKFGEGKY